MVSIFILYLGGSRFGSHLRNGLSCVRLFFLFKYDKFKHIYCKCRELLSHLMTLSDWHIIGRTRLDEGSATVRDLFLTTYNNHKRETPMPSAGIKPPIPASERPHTQTLDRAATGINGAFHELIKSRQINIGAISTKQHSFLLGGLKSSYGPVFVTSEIVRIWNS